MKRHLILGVVVLISAVIVGGVRLRSHTHPLPASVELVGGEFKQKHGKPRSKEGGELLQLLSQPENQRLRLEEVITLLGPPSVKRGNSLEYPLWDDRPDLTGAVWEQVLVIEVNRRIHSVWIYLGIIRYEEPLPGPLL